MKRVLREYIHDLSPSGPHHMESDSLHYLTLCVWLADGITQPIRIIQEQHPSTSAPPSPPHAPVNRHQQEHDCGSPEKVKNHKSTHSLCVLGVAGLARGVAVFEGHVIHQPEDKGAGPVATCCRRQTRQTCE